MKNKLGTILLALATTGLMVTAITAYLRSDIPLIWQACGGITLALWVGYFVAEKDFFSEVLSQKTTQYGMNAVLTSVIVIAISVVANMISSNYDTKKDFTKNQLHTLSDQSIKLVKGLTQEIRMKAFINPTQMQDFKTIFEKYTYYNKEKLVPEYIDVDKDPFAVQKNNIKQAGTIIFESDARSARVENLMGPDDTKLEEKLTNAIIQVAKGDKKKVYFLTGHGEHMITDPGKEGYSELKEAMEGGRYSTETLSLFEKAEVPTDAAILVIAGPKSDFLEHELKAIKTYLANAGKLLLLVEPVSPTNLKPFLESYGIDWKPKKAVLETNALQQLAGGNPLTPIVAQYDGGHEVTRETKQMSIYPVATPIEKSGTTPEGLKATSLFSTSARSLEVSVLGEKVKVEEKTDRKGPLSMAVAVEGTLGKKEEKKEEPKEGEKPKSTDMRMIVVGDSDFASNSARKFGVNSDLVLNMVSWLAHDEDMISIRPKPTDASDLEITEERIRVINLASVVGAPLAMFIAGIAVWANRRRK